MLLAADTVVIFAAIGVGMRWHAHLNRAPAPPNLSCGCGHVLAYHDPASGVCNQQVNHEHYDARGKWVGELRQCSCRQYTGELTADWYARSVVRGEEP